MSSPKTPCHHCGKLYVNVKEHITKSHSWLQLHCKEDGEIVYDKEDCWGSLFWQDTMWKDIGSGDRSCEDDERHTWYTPETLDGCELWVLIKRHPTLPGMWNVARVEFCKYLSDKAVERNGGYAISSKIYKNVNIQVLHKRVPSESAAAS